MLTTEELKHKPINEFPATIVHRRSTNILDSVVSLLAKYRVEPNYITGLGIIFALGAGIFLGFGSWLPAIIFILLNGLSDIIDGQLARKLTERPKYMQDLGVFLDPAADRISDTFFFLGLLGYAHTHYDTFFVLLIAGTLAAHLISSWMRAKVESLDRRFHKNKPLTRPTLLLALMVVCLGGLIINSNYQYDFFFWAVLLLICLSKITTFIAWLLRAIFILVKRKHIGLFS